MKKYFQQGDVLLFTTNENIHGKKLPHTILAEGEVTGHCHTITKGNAELYERDDTMYLKVIDDEAELTHQEHGSITVPKGNYRIGIVRTYDHFKEESKNVQD